MSTKLDLNTLNKKTSITLINFEHEDLTVLKDLQKVKRLEFIRPKLNSLYGIEYLTNLTELILMGSSNLESIDGIDALAEQLISLQITSGKLTNFLNLGKLTNLKSLTLSNLENIDTLSFLAQLTHLKELKIHHIKKCDSLSYISELPHLETIFITPWDVKVDDNSYLPLTKKLVELGKLNQVIEWEEAHKHLDNEGQKIYNDYFKISDLQSIKRNFKFFQYEDFSVPYTKENCDAIDNIIYNLIDTLEKKPNLTQDQKLELIKLAVQSLNKLDDSVTEGTLISTGEREYLCDTLDSIAKAINIDLNKYNNDISLQWRTW